MTAINPVTRLSVFGGVAVVELDSPPVNALSRQAVEGLRKGLDRALARADVRAVVLACAGRTFIAGADICGFDTPGSGADLFALQARIEDAGKPVIAAIHGAALGAGLEIALCCHYRIAVPSARCGLPEVKLGLLPAAGGPQRLTRLIGPERSLELVTGGEPIEALEALELGIFDGLVDEAALREAACQFAARVAAEGRPLRRIRDIEGRRRASPGLFEAFRAANAERFGGAIAPEYNIRCVEAAAALPFDEGLGVEQALFRELVSGPQSEAQRYLFLAQRRAARKPAGTLHSRIGKVGVIGAAAGDIGLARTCLDAGLTVTLIEADDAGQRLALRRLRADYDAPVREGAMSRDEAGRRLRRLTVTTAVGEALACDLIVDLREAGAARPLRADTLVVAGSAKRVAALSAGIEAPARVLGLRLWPAAGRVGAAEVARTTETSDSAAGHLLDLAKRIGRAAVTVRNGNGWIAERTLAAYDRQVVAMIAEGASSAGLTAALKAFGLAPGPVPDGAGTSPPPEDAVERIVLAVINAGARLLDEGTALRGSDIDVVWASGLGWPRHRGGPMYHADALGLPQVLARLTALAARFGPDFEPAPVIRALAAGGGKLTDHPAANHPADR